MRRIAILAEGSFSYEGAKTAIGILRYSQDTVVAILDSTRAGQDAAVALGDPTGLGRGIPVVADVAEVLRYTPDTLVIGIAPVGGKLPEIWRTHLRAALSARLNIISGLHTLLGDDAELAALAREHGATIWDVRKPADDLAMRIRRGTPHRPGSHVVYFCGTDCNVGKMTAAVELDLEARRRGLSSVFAATGQTGIMIAGRGIPADRFISDFESGGVEALVLECSEQAEWVFVEGQGALGHPAYSAVTLGLLHGAAPDLLVLCHQAGRTRIREYEETPIPSLTLARQMYETAAAWLKPAPVVCVALNTFGMREKEARAAVTIAEYETGLPTSDPVRFGAGPLVDALLARR
jgi:uncharacterized NAD-dependent epimerase/dehydratase family protein